MNFHRAKESESPQINLIPLIDVILVILIFLMLTTSFTHVSGLQINLPQGAAEDNTSTAKEIDVGISALGEVTVNGETLPNQDTATVASALIKAMPSGESHPVVVINADAKATHQSVIDVMQAAQQAGLPDVTFTVQGDD